VALHVVVGVIEDKQGRILVAKRPQGKRYANLWEFPGGKVELGESSQEALKRELLEELSIQAHQLEPLVDFTDPFADEAVRLDVWRVKAFDGTPGQLSEAEGENLLGAEGQSLRWVNLQQLADLDFPPANQHILKRLLLPHHIAISQEVGTDSLNAAVSQMKNTLRRYDEYYQEANENLASSCSQSTAATKMPILYQLRLHQATDQQFSAQVKAVLGCDSLKNPNCILINRPSFMIQALSNLFDDLTMTLSEVLTLNFGHQAAHCGIHLTEQTLRKLCEFFGESEHQDLKINRFRRLVVGHSGFIGASCHDAKAIELAQALQLDYLLVSPVLSTQTHPDAKPLGWQQFSRLALDATCPVFALGGLSPSDLSIARTQGAHGVAGIRAFSFEPALS